MHINAINSAGYNKNYKYSQKNFTGLIKDKSVIPIIKHMSKNDISELNRIEKRLSLTKFWDMKISSIGDKINELKFEFIDKQNKHGIITDGIYPYYKENNSIKIYSIIYGPENISKNAVEVLKYKSKNRADAVYQRYMKNLEMVRLKGFNLTPLESIKSKEIELNMLEEASHTTEEGEGVKYIETENLTKCFVGNNLTFKK